MSSLEWLAFIVITSIWMIFCFVISRTIAFAAGGKPRNSPYTKNGEPNVFKCLSCDLRYTHPDPRNVLEYAIYHRSFHKIENNDQNALQDFLFSLEEEKK